jgi:uncharacterized membrane protein YecN with MAPEG domain
MISSFYAALLALLIVWLSLRVIKLRRTKKVRLGDGGEPELQTAIRAQGNATEYIPISLILLALLELNGAHAALCMPVELPCSLGDWCMHAAY